MGTTNLRATAPGMGWFRLDQQPPTPDQPPRTPTTTKKPPRPTTFIRPCPFQPLPRCQLPRPLASSRLPLARLGRSRYRGRYPRALVAVTISAPCAWVTVLVVATALAIRLLALSTLAVASRALLPSSFAPPALPR